MFDPCPAVIRRGRHDLVNVFQGTVALGIRCLLGSGSSETSIVAKSNDACSGRNRSIQRLNDSKSQRNLALLKSLLRLSAMLDHRPATAASSRIYERQTVHNDVSA